MSQKTIFLVDDDSDDRFFMQQAIKSCNVSEQVVEAESVPQLIELLNAPDYEISLIIIDMNMPVMNGLEAIPYIRSVRGGASIPVVMLSTSPSPDLENRAYAAGVASFMAKPNSLTEFGTMVKLIQTKFLA